MKKVLTLFGLVLVCNAGNIYKIEPTLNSTQSKLYNECIKENNAKSCEDYLNTRNYDSDSYLSLKESIDVAFKGCDELKNAYSCHMLFAYYDEGYPPNKFIQDNKEKSFEYNLKACEIDGYYCWFVGNHYNRKYIKNKSKKDKTKALKYYKISCKSKNQFGCENYKELDSWWK